MSSLHKPLQPLLRGTFAQLQAIAAAAPQVVFLGVAVDTKALLFYSGDPTSGNAGFFTLTSYIHLS